MLSQIIYLCPSSTTLGQEDPLEKGMATHSSILTWGIPRTVKTDGYSPQVHKDSDMTD